MPPMAARRACTPAAWADNRIALAHLLLSSGSLMDLEAGQQSLFRYSTVRALIGTDHVECI